MSVINIVAIISYLYVITVNKQPNYVIKNKWNSKVDSAYIYIYTCKTHYFAIIQFFLCTPKCPGSYPRLGITAIHHALPVQSGTA
jgi:hypothetical protein